MINLAIKVFLEKDHLSEIKPEFELRKLRLQNFNYKKKGLIDKIYNTIFYITCSSRLKAMFNKC